MKYFWLLLYYGFAQFLPPSHKNILGNIGKGLRVICAHHLFKCCGSNINIEHRAYFGQGDKVELGSNSGIGVHCHVPSDIKIGDNVMMGPCCFFMESLTHHIEQTEIPMIQQGTYRKQGRIEIGNDVWIGRQCLVLPIKKIGSHSVVGAGSVVCKDVPDSVVAGGNPIRIIRQR